jgi:predicted esterase
MPRRHPVTLLVVGLVAIAIGVACAAATADELADAFRAGDWERAVTVAESIASRHPESAVAAYNAGCACSRAGRLDRAVEWLMKSARLGFSGVRSIRDDDDLDAVRGHAGFAAVREAVEANVAARFAAFKAEAEQSSPFVIMPPDHDPAVETPLLVVLHGTGGTGRGIARPWKRAAAQLGVIIVAPDALRPVRGSSGYSWVFRDEAEWLVLRTIDEARERWRIGPVILAGFSQGANIALMLGQSHPDRFDAVIPVCGHYEADVAELPTAGPRPRWCLLTGEYDRAAPTYVAAERAFRGVGMTVRRDVVPRHGHGMPGGRGGQALLRDVLSWAMENDADPASSPPRSTPPTRGSP